MQTKSYWQLVAAAGLVCAFVGSACTVTTSTDDDDDDDTFAGRSGAGAAGTSGAATAGTAGSTAGAGGASAGAPAGGAGGAVDAPVPFQCDGNTVGTPNTCVPADDAKTDCALCVQAKCCAEFEACYATGPGNQCGWGGPTKVGGLDNVGEISCVQTCLQDGFVANGVVDEDLRTECDGKCTTTIANGATKECGGIIGTQTADLTNCLVEECQTDCIGG